MSNRIYRGENLKILKQLDASSIDLIYIKPPSELNTSDINPDDLNRPFTVGTTQYTNLYDAYLLYLESCLIEAYRILADHGTLYLHSNHTRVHYIKTLVLDPIFGRENFVNEIVWAKQGNGGGSHAWPAKHENILMYSKTPDFKFNPDNIDRIPYLAPGLVSEEKEELGKLPTDTWWYTQNISEKEILKRLISASTDPGDTVLDFFAGTGLTGEICSSLDRRFILIEEDQKHIEEMVSKFRGNEVEWINFD
ncbi:MAG: site-specific DNA-methyltransferase [Anaerolineales bacterium]|nr:site-specific DNA-methyltransferase [Anaerolineales bacterium]